MTRTALNATKLRAMLFVAMALVTLTFATSTANAQIPSVNLRPHLYLGAGTSMITNPTLTKDNLKQGLSLMLAVGLPLNPGIEIVPKMQYHRFGYNSDFILSSGITTADPKMTILTLGADVKWGFIPGPAPAKPYFLVGGGSSTISQDVGGFSFQKIDETKLYMNVGAGLDVKLGPTFAFFVEGKYTFVNSSSASLGIFPLMAGIRIM